MKLLDLEPRFIKYVERAIDQTSWGDTSRHPGRSSIVTHQKVSQLSEAHGIIFLCPKCFVHNNGAVGTHSVICWFEGRVPDTAEPKPGRWNPTGTGFGDLSFVPGKKSCSVALKGGCEWHGFITNGNVT